MTNLAIGYLRVSSQEQADSGLSLAHQEERIRAYCISQNLSLTHVIRDEGVSGGKEFHTRPGGAEAARYLSSGAAQHIVALKLDRMFRDAANALTQANEWDRSGVSLHFVDMGGMSLNTRSPMGKMFFTMAAGFAELERGMIRERTVAAMNVKRQRGEKLGGARPFGADEVRGEDGRIKLIPRADEVAAYHEIRRWAERGKSHRVIAELMAEDGVKVSASTVRRLLREGLPRYADV